MFKKLRTQRNSASAGSGFKKSYDSFSTVVLCNTVIEFVIPMKFEIETKEYRNETYSRDLLDKHLFVLQ